MTPYWPCAGHWRVSGAPSWRTCCSLANCSVSFRPAVAISLSVAAHPGVVCTGLFGHVGASGLLLDISSRIVGHAVGQGILPTLFAATEDIAGGTFVGARRASSGDTLFGWFVIAPAGLAGSLDPRALRPYFGESHTRIRQTVVGIRFERGKRPGPVGDAGIYHYLMLTVR